MTVRTMQIEDYEGVHDLWMTIKGFGIRSIDDSKEGVERFLKRNPTTSVVAEMDGKIVGSILCGHDGRRGRARGIQKTRHRKSDGRPGDGKTERRADQQSFLDRIYGK